MKARNLDELIGQWMAEGHRPIPRRQGEAGTGLPCNPAGAEDEPSFKDLLDELCFLSRRFYGDFVPANPTLYQPDYGERLFDWLHNEGLTPDQQRLLFQFATRIAFFSFADFLQLYRSALAPVARWIIAELGLQLSQPDFSQRVAAEQFQHTWYCPITDSMLISEFYHANGITGIDQRPPFSSLYHFGRPESLIAYMERKQLKRLVLFEDFVGTGRQTRTVVEWAVKNLGCPVLFIPLLICPAGAESFDQLASAYPGRLQVVPVRRLEPAVFAAPGKDPDDLLLRQIVALAQELHPLVKGDPDQTFGPFGYKDTGSTVVLFTNTPANTLPLVHHNLQAPAKWKALFPRVKRHKNG